MLWGQVIRPACSGRPGNVCANSGIFSVSRTTDVVPGSHRVVKKEISLRSLTVAARKHRLFATRNRAATVRERNENHCKELPRRDQREPVYAIKSNKLVLGNFERDANAACCCVWACVKSVMDWDKSASCSPLN